MTVENLPLTWEEVEAILKQIPDLKAGGVKRFFNQGLFYRVRYAPGEIVMPKGVHSDFAGIHLSGGLRVLPDDPPAAMIDAPVLDCWRRPGPRFRGVSDWVLDRTDRLPPPEPVKEAKEGEE
ncbi:MAG: hypothetical protein HY000_29970, partial [Planctomycetes bacterium]|nr:hypothetical protein [Planctomycetota bacterium]